MGMHLHLRAVSVVSEKPCSHCGKPESPTIHHFELWNTPTHITEKILKCESDISALFEYSRWAKTYNSSHYKYHVEDLRGFVLDHDNHHQWRLEWYQL
jgi:hypothetical protein